MRNFIFLGLLSLLINTSCEPSIEDTNCSKDIDSQLAELSDLTLELLDYDYDFDEYCKFFKKTWFPAYVKTMDCLLNSAVFTAEQKKVLKASLEQQLNDMRDLSCQ
jgi:hypothetical protein